MQTLARLFFLQRGERMKDKGYWKRWAAAAGIRALKTMAQTAVASIGAAVLIEAVNWWAVLSASLLAGVLSLLMSLAGLPEVKEEDKNTWQ